MNESFLHYIWSSSQFSKNDLKTSDGSDLTILRPGYSHHDGGPDFENAHIRIGETLWVGNVEIHVSSKEWYNHKHHLDSTYDSTILHVVFRHDVDVYRSNGGLIPTLELKNRISDKLIRRYSMLTQNSDPIPCHKLVNTIPPEIKQFCLESMAVERLRYKTQPIQNQLNLLHNNWNEALHREVFAAMGSRVNTLPFRNLAKELPFTLLAKYKNNLHQIESLLFGTAGFLRHSARDEYERSLVHEYRFLKTKHNLNTIDLHLWKFMRMRPANFPTIRLAQLAMLIHKGNLFFGKMKNNLRVNDFYALFQSGTSAYWSKHYRFGETTEKRRKTIGNTTIDLILINAVVPVLFCYAQHTSDLSLQDKLLSLLEEVKAENNKTTRYFRSLDFSISNAIHSQGALHLKNKFCTFKNCLQCQIGHHILKSN
ncbi:MAG: DUF2851 family protein [Bacteroidia bacterium]|nr:DUF2851 family protein [Bacteroidia bacterium]